MLHGIPMGASSSWQGGCPPIHEHEAWAPPVAQNDVILPNPGYSVEANIWHLDITQSASNFWKNSFFPGEFEGAKLLKNYERKQFSRNCCRNNFVSEGISDLDSRKASLQSRVSEKLEKAVTVENKNTPHGRLGQGPGSVGPRFAAGLPFLRAQILEFKAFRDSGKIFQHLSRIFPANFPREPMNRSRKQPQPSRVF